MPKRKDIKSILIIGAGPIVIGQACEFDYSGTQAVKALRAHDCGEVLLAGKLARPNFSSLKLDAKGRCLNPNFTDYLIPTTLDVPEIDIVLVEQPYGAGPFGAKGIGEPSLIPMAAAVANAVHDATGHRFTNLPLSPERVLLELADAGKLR